MFSNDIQVNLRSYFDRWRETENPSGAPLPPGTPTKQSRSASDLSDASKPSKQYLSPNQAYHRRQKAKLTNASKLLVDWKISENQEGTADGTVIVMQQALNMLTWSDF